MKLNMFGFGEARAAVESEGVYIGGWSIKQAARLRQKDAGKSQLQADDI